MKLNTTEFSKELKTITSLFEKEMSKDYYSEDEARRDALEEFIRDLKEIDQEIEDIKNLVDNELEIPNDDPWETFNSLIEDTLKESNKKESNEYDGDEDDSDGWII